MRHTTTETHKMMLDLIDGIRRAPGLSQGVKHRAEKLREKQQKENQNGNI